ncbi:hypothetical protein C2S53_007632 [Perilla frutescens var. hirtella]|uniref:Avr9/Cf-9 rapidly elicited protein 146 n=1 Tax=Perilla frutescens var. hirtella TaxID=608512 RepID=A0AAD4NWM3_PERFH|nr:hypothetical protein C2S53_007632 [Perilla frutescens var. hirtella]
MEQSMPIIAKKFWKIVKVAYFMLRKGVSKAKLLSDLSMMMKRGKIAGKAAMQNLIFHVHHHHVASSAAAQEPQLSYPTPLNEYEFSCSSSPAYPTFRLPFHLNKRKQSHAAPPPQPSENELWAAAVEMASSVAPSPALPGFGRTPVVRQLRITDSPFPLREIEEDNRVDEAADKFIMKFYRDLKKQNSMAS